VRAWPRKLIRFSVHAPRAENSYVLAECGLSLRARIKRADIGSKNPTFSDLNSQRARFEEEHAADRTRISDVRRFQPPGDFKNRRQQRGSERGVHLRGHLIWPNLSLRTVRSSLANGYPCRTYSRAFGNVCCFTLPSQCLAQRVNTNWE
jgi:hypothetical protein